MFDIRSFPDFDSAARAVLWMLRDHVRFDLWMVTRTEGESWIVLQAENDGYGIQEGDVFRWADSLCCQMIAGRGPRVAPSVAEVPSYSSAPIARRFPIGAYVGVPLTREDGSLFGTLCAFHRTAHPPAVTAALPVVELFARLLCTILDRELKAMENARRADSAQAEALTDALTGLHNRRGWDQLLATEERRCRALGLPAAVLSIDLDGLKHVNDTKGHAVGDELIRAAARTIRDAIRGEDLAARVGGDEFFVLAVECDKIGAERLDERVRGALHAAGVAASVGVAQRDPRRGLPQAVRQADKAMYVAKNARRAVTFVSRSTFVWPRRRRASARPA